MGALNHKDDTSMKERKQWEEEEKTIDRDKSMGDMEKVILGRKLEGKLIDIWKEYFLFFKKAIKSEEDYLEKSPDILPPPVDEKDEQKRRNMLSGKEELTQLRYPIETYKDLEYNRKILFERFTLAGFITRVNNEELKKFKHDAEYNREIHKWCFSPAVMIYFRVSLVTFTRIAEIDYHLGLYKEGLELAIIGLEMSDFFNIPLGFRRRVILSLIMIYARKGDLNKMKKMFDVYDKYTSWQRSDRYKSTKKFVNGILDPEAAEEDLFCAGGCGTYFAEKSIMSDKTKKARKCHKCAGYVPPKDRYRIDMVSYFFNRMKGMFFQDDELFQERKEYMFDENVMDENEEVIFVVNLENNFCMDSTRIRIWKSIL